MNSKTIAFLLCSLGSHQLLSQDIDSLLRLHGTTTGQMHYQVVDELIYYYESRNFDSVKIFVDEMCSIASQTQDAEALWDCQYNVAKWLHNTNSYADALREGRKALVLARQNGDSVAVAKVLNLLGVVHEDLGNYEQSLDYYFESLALREQLGNKGMVVITLSNIGLIYKNLDEWAKCLDVFRQCLHLDIELDDLYGQSYDYNHIGIAFNGLHSYDSALHYLQLSLDLAAQLDDRRQLGIVYSNMGQSYYFKGRYDQAIFAQKQALYYKEQLENARDLGISWDVLSRIYIASDSLSKAIDAANKCLDLGEQLDIKELQMKAHETLAEAHERLGRYEEALKSQKSYQSVSDSILNTAKSKQIAELEIIYETEKKEQAIAALELAQQNEELKRWALSGGLTLSLILGLVIVLSLRARMKKNGLIREKEKALDQQKITAIERQLQEYTKNLLDKQSRIEQLNHQLQEVQAEISRGCPSYAGSVQQLMQSTILTEEEWQRFRNMFLQVYPGFFAALRQEFPDVSPTEERLLALTRLNLNTREIASMLGVSADSVKKSKYRLRKRLNISSDEMEELVATI